MSNPGLQNLIASLDARTRRRDRIVRLWAICVIGGAAIVVYYLLRALAN